MAIRGQLRLLPDDVVLVSLAQDFQRMIDAGMFIGAAPAFDQIIRRLRLLEADINKSTVLTGQSPQGTPVNPI